MNGNSDQIRSKLSTKIVNTMLAIILVLGLSPLSKASASVANDSAQQDAEQTQQVATESADGANSGAADAVAAAGNATSGSADAGSASASASGTANSADASAATPTNQGANSVTGGGASGAVTENGKAAATATQNTQQSATESSNDAVAVPGDETADGVISIDDGYTTGVTVSFEKKVGDGYAKFDPSTDEVSDSDQLKVRIDIKFGPTGISTIPSADQPIVKYKIPANITAITKEWQDLKLDGVKAGSWCIEGDEESGYFGVFKLDETWLDTHSSGFEAGFSFDFIADMDGVPDGGSLDLSFPGTGTVVSLNSKRSDVSAEKTVEGGYNYDSNEISYKVKVTVSERTAEGLELTDVLGKNLQFDPSSFTFEKENVWGSVQGVTPSISDNGSDGTKATISLGNLEPGTYYLKYKASISSDVLEQVKSGDAVLDSSNAGNKVNWKWSGGSKDGDEVAPPDVSFDKNMISKTGSVDANGDITWTIRLNSGTSKVDMGGYVFNDKLENDGQHDQSFEGSYVVRDDTTGEIVYEGALPDDDSFSYTFDDKAGNHAFTITYKTKVTNQLAWGTYKNTSTVAKGDDSETSTGSVDIRPKDDQVINKTIESHDDEANTAEWTCVVKTSNMDASVLPSQIAFTDSPDSAHLCLIGEPELTFDGTVLQKGIDYELEIQNGYWGFANGKAGSYTVKFLDNGALKGKIGIQGLDISIKVKTQCDGSSNIDLRNNASVTHGSFTNSASAKYTIEKAPQISKSGSMDWADDFSWNAIDQSDSDTGAWISKWTVRINGGGDNGAGKLDLSGQDIKVTDNLPDGCSYVPGSMRQTIQMNYYPNREEVSVPDEWISVDGRKLTVTIPSSELQKVASLNGTSLEHQFAYIELNYQTAAKASVASASGNEAEKVEFTNSASASSGGISFPEGSATVSKEQPVLSKESAVDLSKEDGRVKYVKYTVKANPLGAMLNNGNDLVLSDVVDAKATLIGSLVSVKNLRTGETLAGASVDIQTVKDDSNNSTSKLTVTVPDGTPVLVEYWVAPNLAAGSDLSLSNTVNLTGSKEWSTKDGYSGKVLKADAYVRGLAGSISVVKYDKSDRDKTLDGAEFKLYRVDMDKLVELGSNPTDDQIADISSLVSVKTTSSGQVVFDKDGDRSLSLYSLYYFKETRAPVVDGVSYEISDPSAQYFMLRNIYAETNEEIQKDKEEYDAAYAKVKGSNLRLSDAHSYEMKDAKTGKVSVPVQKKWEGKEGDSATFELYANGVATGKVLTLTANDGWTGVFDGLEKYDGEDNEIVYTVKEQAIADYDSTQQTALDGTVVFTNTYTKPAPAATSFTAQVKKQLNGGRDLKDQEFEFVLKKGDKEIAHAKNAADGTVVFKDVQIKSVDDGGEYTISEIKGSDSSVEYSDQVVKVNVDVAEENGKLIVSVSYGDDKSTDIQTITNTFKPAAVSATVEASKELTGRDLKAEEFTFQLKEGDDLIAEATNDANGKVVFPADKLTFDATGEHDYTISEVAKTGDDARGVTYDTTVRKVHVSVIQDNETGALTAEVSYPDGGDKPFENTYVAKGTSVSFDATKALEGKALADKQFSFQVKEGDKVVATATNDAEGKVTFPELRYSEAGEHDYFISEVVPEGGVADGITYDQSVYKVHVSAEDNGEGQLVPEVTYKNAEGETIGSGDVKFNNSYKETQSIVVSLRAHKTLDGNTPTAGQKFTFNLNKMNPDGSKGDLIATAENDKGEVSFGGSTYSDAADEWYLISEQQKGGYNCDGKIVKVHVVVTKGADNQLTPQITYVDGESESNEVPTFSNKTVAPASATISVRKFVEAAEDANIKGDEQFTFELYKANDKGEKEGDALSSVSVVKDATADFSRLSFSEEGTYKYLIHEVGHDSKGWSVKENDILATVMVTKSGDGNLVTSVLYSEGTDDGSAAKFVDAYAAASTSASLGAKKELEGAGLEAGQFSFQLKGADGEVLQTKANDAEGNVAFDAISYKKAGTYKYEIAEVNDGQAGITYDSSVTEAIVEVVDNGEGQLVASVMYGDSGAMPTFKNGYAKPAPAATSFAAQVKKQLNGGRVLKDKEFEFVLKKGDSVIAHAVNDAEGAVTFEDVPINSVDDGGEYTISEVKGSDSSVEYSDQVVKVNVDVAEADGKLSASVSYGENKTTDIQTITNTFKPTAVPVTVKASKTLTGRDLKEGEFTFQLKDGSDVVATATNDADGNVSFSSDRLFFNGPGEHDYEIFEVAPAGGVADGVTYDRSVYQAHVSVNDNGEGQLVPEVTYKNAQGEGIGSGDVKFNNSYTATGQATLSVLKTVNGGTEQGAGQKFRFDLYKADEQGNAQGEKIDSVETGVGEKADFGSIELTGEGTYRYVIKESDHNNGAWFAAPDVQATVTAADNGDGTLDVNVAYSNASGQKDAALFDNTYAPANASIQVKKTVNGETAPADKHFTFVLQPQDGAPMPEEATADTFGGDTCSFGNIEFEEEGEYRYVIHETADLGEGWTNAADVPVMVKVARDEAAKALKVESIDYGESAYEENGQAMALFDNKYEQPEQPESPNGDTPEQSSSDTPGSDQPTATAPDDAKSSGVKTGDSLILVGGALALVAVAAAGIAAFALRRRK